MVLDLGWVELDLRVPKPRQTISAKFPSPTTQNPINLTQVYDHMGCPVYVGRVVCSIERPPRMRAREHPTLPTAISRIVQRLLEQSACHFLDVVDAIHHKSNEKQEVIFLGVNPIYSVKERVFSQPYLILQISSLNVIMFWEMVAMLSTSIQN